MRSDTNQLDLIRDDPRMADPVMAKAYRDEAQRALTAGDTAHFTAEERYNYYMAEAAKYESNQGE